MTNTATGAHRCSTCGQFKGEHMFPRDACAPGVLPTCKACVVRTERLEKRAQRLRRVTGALFPPEPLQVELRRRLERSTQMELSRRIGTRPDLIRGLLRRTEPLRLSTVDRWAMQLDSHIDLIYEVA